MITARPTIARQVSVTIDPTPLARPVEASYDTYRTIRKDPTVVLARAAAMAPVLAQQWAVEADPDAPAEAVAMIRDTFLPMRSKILWEAMLGDLDYGCTPWEKVFEIRADGRTWLKKLKYLSIDKTEILVSPGGDFAGLRQDKTTVGLPNALLVSFRAEADNHYGEPRLEYVRETWQCWRDASDGAARYDRKLAGVHLLVEYPPGESTDETGTSLSNAELADRICKRFQASGAIAIPRDMGPFAGTVDASESPGWRIDLLSEGGGQQPAFIERLRYLDSLKCRALLVPERAITEGQHGTLAESEAQADIAVEMAGMAHADITRAVQWHVVDQLLALNWGDAMRGKVRLTAPGMSAAQKAFLREVYTAMLGNPSGFLEEYGALDLSAVREQLGLPQAAPGEEQPVQPVPLPGVDPDDPSAEAVKTLYRDLQGLGEGGTAQLPSAAQEPASVQATALNGAQIASLLGIVQQVQAGTMSVEAAAELIGIAFPSLDKAQVNSLLTAATRKG